MNVNFFPFDWKPRSQCVLRFADRAVYYCLFVCLLTNFTKILSEADCFWFVFASGILFAVFMSFEVTVTFIWAAILHTNPGGFS